MPFKVHNKTFSVHGGAGGQGTRISSYWPVLFYGSSWEYNTAGLLNVHRVDQEKATMKNLNDRLASFMKNINSMERRNAELQKNITEWSRSCTVDTHEYSGFLATTRSLNKQIQQISMSNREIALHLQNYFLIADDFKRKYEAELSLHTSVEMDIVCLRKLMDEITLSRSNIEMEYETMKEKCIILEKNHEEEKAQIRARAGVQVDVCVEAAPPTDLNKILTNIREDYEALIAKNHKEQEAWFKSKISTMETKFNEQTEDLESSNIKRRHLKSSVYRMEIEIEAQESMTKSLKDVLQDVKSYYAAEQAELQKIVSDLKNKIKEIKLKKTDFAQDIENLKVEIEEYRQLLPETQEVNSDHQVAYKNIEVLKVVERSQKVTTQE